MSDILDRGRGRNYDVSNNMSIPPYDYMKNTYNTNNSLTNIEYYYGGLSGEKVAEVVLTYDSNGNLISVERVL